MFEITKEQYYIFKGLIAYSNALNKKTQDELKQIGQTIHKILDIEEENVHIEDELYVPENDFDMLMKRLNFVCLEKEIEEE